jgi:hypothetical protein
MKLQKSSIQFKFVPALLIIFTLGSFAICQSVPAVIPAPDGGYPGFNTAEGTNALKNLTTGIGNAAVGWYSLFSNTDGSFNTGVGAGTLALNTGGNNTAVGGAALLSNTTGIDNTAVGVTALVSNSTGYLNTATGVNALSGNTVGVGNNAFGWGALLSNTTGTNNNAMGVRALQNNTEGGANVAVGEQALLNNTIGSGNTAIGFFALQNNNGIENTALGYNAGFNVNSGSGNVCIGSGVTGFAGISNTTWIRNIWGHPGGTQAVYVDEAGRLGMNSSSRRFKEDIKPMDKASEVIYSLKPVSFRYKTEIERTRPLSFGLIAEDVEQINTDLVLRGKDGKVSTVRYEAVNAMLLNEFLKEHKKVEELESTVATLAATVKEQAAEIQKVSAQLRIGGSTPQIVANNP